MKRIGLAVFFCWLFVPMMAQQGLLSYLLNTPVSKINRYEVHPAALEKTYRIPCSYAKNDLAFADSIHPGETEITAIDLVFTDYPSDDDLRPLNKSRLIALLKKYPGLAKIPGEKWQLVRQTGGAIKDSATGMFHGFVIYYRPAQSPATQKHDSLALRELLKEPPVSARVKRHAFIAGDTTHLRERYEIEPYTRVQKLPAKDAIAYIGLPENELKYYPNYDSLYVYEIPDEEFIKPAKKVEIPVDSTVWSVFNRMNNWRQMLVVTDVTASMYPYTGQLLLWMKLHEDERAIRRFVFFNDGNNMEEDMKRAGSTGGIYSTGSSVFEVVEETAFKAMGMGSGGAIPENNIEALLRGISDCPDCYDIVMIADNNSPVSDMVLLPQVRKPVHIILCGVHDAINPDYLTIAKATNGTVHLMNEDLPALVSMNEGQEFRLGKREYKITKGKVELKKVAKE